MALKAEPVEVCVCGAVQDASLVLHRLAAGDMLGSKQAMQLTLTGDVEQMEDLQETAWDLNDACYPLLRSVTADKDLSRFSAADVILLLVPNNLQHSQDGVQLWKEYAAVLNSARGIRCKTVIVVGKGASAAAGILRILAPHLSSHLLLAVDTAPHSGYLQTQAVCSSVRQWWSGVQESETVVLGVGFHGIPKVPFGCVLPVPVSITSPLTAVAKRDKQPDWVSISAFVDDFLNMSQSLGVDESAAAMNCVESRL